MLAAVCSYLQELLGSLKQRPMILSADSGKEMNDMDEWRWLTGTAHNLAFDVSDECVCASRSTVHFFSLSLGTLVHEV
jgi:hypothetical protein